MQPATGAVADVGLDDLQGLLGIQLRSVRIDEQILDA